MPTSGMKRRRGLAGLIAWHYTTGLHFRGIVEAFQLGPARLRVQGAECAVLWFSLNQQWERTAERLDGEGGGRGGLDREEAHRLRRGRVRFGYPAEKCVPWPQLARKAGIPPHVRVDLERAGRKQGANPADWCGVLNAIPLPILILEVQRGRHWVRLHDPGSTAGPTKRFRGNPSV